MALEENIREVLSHRKRNEIVDSTRGPAAVLIPIYGKNGEYHILMTKRTQSVMYHKGQVCFPGGTRDEEDPDLLTTAIRESGEEIGLRAEDIEILGVLDDMFTITSMRIITPFVASIPYPYDFKISPSEVEELVEIPISALLDKGNFREETGQYYDGRLFPVYFFRYRDWTIIGATAVILKRFLDLVFPE